MSRQHTIPAELRRALDGYDVDRGFGRTCPSCAREYEPGERVLVLAERPSDAASWTVSSVVCAECGRQSIPEERRESSQQALVSAALAASGLALALDGERARLLDRSPATDG